MSLPHNGSTAPTISSPLLAWPSKPSARSSPSPSSPLVPVEFPRRPSSSTSFTLTANGTMTASSSMTVADSQPADPDTNTHKGSPRMYSPPRKPLDPQRLGRIAQSFGIVVPSLPDFAIRSATLHAPLPSSAPIRPSSPYNRSTTPTLSTGSPHLLTVLPPAFLLPPSSSDATGAEDKLRRWRRGKLLPLQPNLRLMTLSIAREWGLPSTQGLELYLSTGEKGKGREIDGPQITSQTWAALFQPYLLRSAPSINRLASAAGLERLRTDSLESSLSSSPSTRLGNELGCPPTPLSWDGHGSASGAESTTPVIAILEFDIDVEKADTWIGKWRESGGSRRAATASPVPSPGRRDLALVSKLEQQSQPRFLAELAAADSESEDEEIEEDGYAALSDGSDMAGSSREAFEHDEEDEVFDEDLSKLRASREARGSTSRTLDIRDIGTDAVLAHDAAFEDDELQQDDVDDVLNMLNGTDDLPPMRQFVDEDRLLASPIALGRFAASDDKRASGIVMSEKLDDLEKALRSLSPRDLRLTSPRVLPPAEGSSPLSSSSLPTRKASRPARSPLIPAPLTPREDIEQTISVPAWPAVPFATVHSPVLSQHSEKESRNTVLSPETMQRMEYEPMPVQQSPSGWKPQRPARPPSPDLSVLAAREHPLSPEIVQAIERHTGESPKASETVVLHRERSNSKSFKGLRNQMSIPKMNKLWHRKDERMPEIPSSHTTIGLFPVPVNDSRLHEDETQARPPMESFQSERSSRGGPDEFGAVTQPLQNGSSSLPSKSSGGFGRRILSGFGGRKREPGSPEATTRQRVISSPIVVQKGSGLDPPSASPSTPPTVPGSPSHHSLTSPASPRSVRRKPVPSQTEPVNALPNSMSLASSMASFVLDDPPKRKIRAV